MNYPIYQEPTNHSLLSQGDILDPAGLRENLKGHQDYFANRSYFYRFMVLTQSCDLDRKRGMSDFIFLAVVRKLEEAIRRRQVEDASARSSTEKLLSDIFNHNYNSRGFFYLPQDES